MPVSTPCPVCSTGVYSDPDAPMATRGTDNPQRHSCVDNGTWKARTRFGGSPSRLMQKLRDTPTDRLAGWPRVLQLKVLVDAGQPLP